MSRSAVAQRLTTAAFDLFAEQGYEQTTIEEIAARADTSRTTFFRHYRSKEEVIFPDHDVLLAAVEARLAASTADNAIIAVCEAIRIVLTHYVTDEDVSRRRYALTSTIPTLRDRELVSGARYQKLLRQFIAGWAEDTVDGRLTAELMAGAVVAAHNQVLRRWLRRESTTDPLADLDRALEYVVGLFPGTSENGSPTTRVVVLGVETSESLDVLVERLKRTL